MAKATDQESTTIRLSKATVARMRAEIARLVLASESGNNVSVEINCEPINPLSQGITYDQLLNLLLDQRQAHRERSKRSKQSKQSKQSKGE